MGLVVAVLAAGTLRTLAARKAKQTALESQQTAQKIQVPIDLMATDLVTLHAMDLTLSVALSGTLKAVNTAFVKARTPGELQGLTVREGDFVKAGQVLGRIDSTESDARLRQAREQALAAKSQVDVARRSHDNNLSLVAQGFISSTALATTQAGLSGAQATYAAAQSATDVAEKGLSDTVLRAPIAGQIAQRLAQPGERVGVDARIVEIVDLSRLELEAALSASDAAQVKVGQRALLQVEGLGQPITASVVRINPSVSVGSRAVLVYLAVAPGHALRQGLFAEGALTTGTLHGLAVPLSAVRTDRPKPYVQVVQTNQVRHLNVALGQRSTVEGQTLVSLTGVAPGASVIAGSVGVLREGTAINIKPVAAGQP